MVALKKKNIALFGCQDSANIFNKALLGFNDSFIGDQAFDKDRIEPTLSNFSQWVQQGNQPELILLLSPMASYANDQIADLTWIIENYEALFAFVQTCAKGLTSNQMGGQIIFIQSVVGEIGHPEAINSSMLAGAINGLCKSLAKEVARYNISVNIIAVGECPELGLYVPTNDEYKKLFTATKLGESVSISQIAKAVNFLHESKMAVTGQVIRVDGGMVI